MMTPLARKRPAAVSAQTTAFSKKANKKKGTAKSSKIPSSGQSVGWKASGPGKRLPPKYHK